MYPYARIEQRKYWKSPEGLTKSVRFSGLFFLPRKVYSRGLHRITIQHGKVVNLWLDQFWEIVWNTHADRRSESELIHSGVVKPKKWIKFDSLSLSKNSCRGEHCSPVPVCLWKIFPGKRVAAPSRRATNGRPYTFNRPRMWFFDTLSESNLIHSHISPKRALCGADALHRTRTRHHPQNRRLARLWGCGAAWAVQLTTGE